MYVIPDANFCIMRCKDENVKRNAIILATETDYMLRLQTINLQYPREIYDHMINGNHAAMIRL